MGGMGGEEVRRQSVQQTFVEAWCEPNSTQDKMQQDVEINRTLHLQESCKI